MGSKKAFRSKYIYMGIDEKMLDGYMIIENNRIMALVNEKDAKNYMDQETELYDFKDKFIMAGFHDFHVHLLIGAMMEHDGMLRYADSEEEAVEILWEKNRERKDDMWILGGAWDHFRWPDAKLPTKKSLDKYFPERPVLLLNKECHGAWANSKALHIFGVNGETVDPENGGFERFTDGEPTGYIHEQAMVPMFQKVISEMADEELAQLAKSFVEKANSLGITSVGDLPIYGIMREGAYKILHDQGALTVRINFATGMMEPIEKIKKLEETFCGPALKFIGTKDFLDGTPMGHSGYMIEPYSDWANFTSKPMIAPEVLKSKVVELDKAQIKVRLHACGDGAVRLGLDAFEEAKKVNGVSKVRHCIEHIESIAPEDIKRFGQLGVVASVQPEHMPKYDFYNHPFHSMIGEARMRHSWPFKSLEDSGAKLAYGTDYPVAELNPLQGVYRSVTRLTNEGEPKGGFNPLEKVSLHHTLRAYTYGSAYAAGCEDILGTLEVGKLADFIVVDKNIFDCIEDREAVFSIKVLMTVMDGNIVYRKD